MGAARLKVAEDKSLINPMMENQMDKVTKRTVKKILKNFQKSLNLESGPDSKWFKSVEVGTRAISIPCPDDIANRIDKHLMEYICDNLPEYRIVFCGNGSHLLYYKEGPHKGYQYECDYGDRASINHY